MKMECDLVDARAEGFQEGIEQGISQGIEQGISMSKYETCKNALSMGLSPENVAVLTGLSIEEIKDIMQEL